MDHDSLQLTFSTKGGRIICTGGTLEATGKTRREAFSAWHTRYLALSEPEQTTLLTGTGGAGAAAGKTGTAGGGGAGAAA